MKIYLGADHNGYQQKTQLAEFLKAAGHEVIDCGDLEYTEADDFPYFAGQVATALLGDSNPEARGILLCGSGQGMCMAANRFKGIRASLCWNEAEARSARNDDDSNVLCLSAHQTDFAEARAIVTTWLGTAFAAAPRFVRRLKQLDELV